MRIVGWPVLLRIIAGSFLFLCSQHAFSQGQIIFDNLVVGQVVAPVYDLEPGNPELVKKGDNEQYNGPRLSGTGYSAQLFGGPTNSEPYQLTALDPATVFRAGSYAGFVVPAPRSLAIPEVLETERAKIQLRVWENRGGAISNWNQAVADFTVARGESLPFISLPLGGVSNTPPNLVGLESFNIALPATPGSRIRVNFQTNGVPVPPGYLPDVGELYGIRTNGLAYGWTSDHRPYAADRNAPHSPYQQYDTFIAMQPTALWELAVTNAIYSVRIVAGDPIRLDGVYRINVEGASVVHGTPAASSFWVEGTAVVPVHDGRLTISNGIGAFNNRICFIEIIEVPRPSLRPATPPVMQQKPLFTFLGIPGVRYEIQRAASLPDWIFAGVPANNYTNLFEWPERPVNSRFFFRAEIALPASPVFVYSTGFETTFGTEWSNQRTAVTPVGGRRFLGPFGGNDSVSLTLSNLPPHTRASISFDLYVIGSWDGNDPRFLPDVWNLGVFQGETLLNTTFEIAPNAGEGQAYPGNLGSSFPARTGALENDSHGFQHGDSVYQMNYIFRHTNSALRLIFSSSLTDSLATESWGLDNVSVNVQQNPY